MSAAENDPQTAPMAKRGLGRLKPKTRRISRRGAEHLARPSAATK
jgi:hypothetical protein